MLAFDSGPAVDAQQALGGELGEDRAQLVGLIAIHAVRPVLDVLERIVGHVHRQAAGQVDELAALLKAEILLGELGLLLVAPGIEA